MMPLSASRKTMTYLKLEKLNWLPEQERYLNSTARFIAADCGRRSGKTEIAFRRMIRALLQQHPTIDHPLYLWGLPTEDQAKNTIWFKLLRTFEPLMSICKTRDMTLEVQTGFRPDGTPTSSKILVRGMMNAARVEGVGYCGVVLDEMSDMPPSAYLTSVFPAISDLRCNGWCMLIGVPKVRGIGAQFFKSKCEEWETAGPGYARFHWTSDMVLPESTINEAMKQLDVKTFREQFQASWETASGLVYYAFDENTHVRELEADPNKPLLVSCDFNISPMSWIICQADISSFGMLEGEIRVLDEIRLVDSNTPEALDKLWEEWGNWPGGYQFFGDAAGNHHNTTSDLSDYVIIEQDERYKDKRDGMVHINVPAANPRVLSRIASVNAALKSAAGQVRMYIHPTCYSLIEDFKSVAYLDGERHLDKRNANLTHTSDALGYLVHTIAPIGFDSIEDRIPMKI